MTRGVVAASKWFANFRENSGSLRFGRRDTRYTLKIYRHLVWGALRRNAETAVAMLDGTTPSKIRAHVHTQAHIHT